jgi:O-methyltransferase
MQSIPPTVTTLDPQRHDTFGPDVHAAAAQGSDLQSCVMAAEQLYLRLIKKSLTFMLYGLEDEYTPIPRPRNPLKRFIFDSIKKRGVELLLPKSKDFGKRFEGKDWPLPRLALTAIGMIGLDNLQFCVEDVLRRGVSGDLIETGAWRGGASIFMRSVLKAHGVQDRKVYVADSFEGLPKPDLKKYPADAGDNHHTFDFLAVSLEQVKENFARYGLLDDQVCFIKGWFRDTLPTLKDKKWAMVRLDGDMYESTRDGLVNLYPNLSVGGYVIVDDYGTVEGCREAVEDYRRSNKIEEPIYAVDWGRAFWQKLR